MAKQPPRSKEELIREAALKAPLALLSLRDEADIRFANSLLPYSVGFEIECHGSSIFDYQRFKEIPYIMDSPAQYEQYEFRFRIPNGIQGFLCLYAISIQCKLMLVLNPGSGIHYHGDMTDTWGLVPREGSEEWKTLKDTIAEPILCELDTWKTGCSYPRTIGFGKGLWLGFRDGHKTIELRTGDMTFEYPELSYRVMSTNKVLVMIKDYLTRDHKAEVTYRTYDPKPWTAYFKGKNFSKVGTVEAELKEALKKKSKLKPVDPDQEEMNRIIQERLKQ